MVMYRVITDEEFKKITNGDKSIGKPDYDKIHFFKYGQHARMFLPYYGQMIFECDIPDYLIEEIDYVNFYPYKFFAVGVPIPEYIIKKNDFDYAFVKNINPDIGCNDGKLYGKFLNDMYKKWKKNNKNYFNDKYGFYDYVVNYLKDKNLDDILREFANKYNEKKGFIRLRKR